MPVCEVLGRCQKHQVLCVPNAIYDSALLVFSPVNCAFRLGVCNRRHARPSFKQSALDATIQKSAFSIRGVSGVSVCQHRMLLSIMPIALSFNNYVCICPAARRNTKLRLADWRFVLCGEPRPSWPKAPAFIPKPQGVSCEYNSTASSSISGRNGRVGVALVNFEKCLPPTQVCSTARAQPEPNKECSTIDSFSVFLTRRPRRSRSARPK